MIHLWQTFLHLTGSDNTSGIYYGFWSGFGSDLGEITLIGMGITWYKHHKCTSCWRLAKHKVEGTSYATCHKHTTLTDHTELQAKHLMAFPEQHKFLRRTIKK